VYWSDVGYRKAVDQWDLAGGWVGGGGEGERVVFRTMQGGYQRDVIKVINTAGGCELERETQD